MKPKFHFKIALINNFFLIPALVFHGIIVASQSLHLQNIWQQITRFSNPVLFVTLPVAYHQLLMAHPALHLFLNYF